jgi:hypothetical protein
MCHARYEAPLLLTLLPHAVHCQINALLRRAMPPWTVARAFMMVLGTNDLLMLLSTCAYFRVVAAAPGIPVRAPAAPLV